MLGVLLLAAGTGAAVAQAPPPPQPPERVLAAEAFAAIDADAFDRARRITAQLDDPLLRKVLHWYILVQQRTGGRFADYVAFMEANPHWPWQYTLQYRAEGVMPAALPDAEVRAFFAEREPVSAYGAERYADALIDQGLVEAGRALLRHAWLERDFPHGDAERFRARYDRVLDAELDWRRLDRLIWERNFAAAEELLPRVGPGRRALARARMKLARMESGVDAAIAAVPQALRDDPGLIYERARWRQRKGRFEDTVALLDPPRPEAPKPEVWWSLRHWAARSALDRGDISLAYRLAANHGLNRGIGFAQGEWLAGWIALRFLQEPARALTHFSRLYEGVSTPVSRARGAYWAGRSAEAAGQPARGRRWYETAATNLTTFYGQLAAARLGEELFLALPRPPAPTAEAQAAFDRRELVRAVRALAEVSQEARANRFIVFLAEQAEDAIAAKQLADLAQDIGRRDLAVWVAREVRRRGIILPDHLYPVVPVPEGAAPQVAAGNALVLAIARQESNFRTAAVSPAGAYGLMQLIPATAEHMAGELDIGFSRSRLLHDPAYNMRLGSAYLNDLIARYDGSLLLAVAAYNAGPSRVARWLERYGDPRSGFVGPVDWVESLPFSETRNYVQRVFESLMIYHHRVAPTKVAVALDSELLLRAGEPRRIGDARPDVSCCL